MKKIMLLSLIAALAACDAPPAQPTQEGAGGGRPAEGPRPQEK